MYGDGKGNWHDNNGLALVKLTGCIDIDIAATPFTNTLPIRRLKLEQGERKLISVVYISMPDLEVKPVDQAYTCIKPNDEYRYESTLRDFAANMKIDGDGLVIDYPSLFKRLPQV